MKTLRLIGMAIVAIVMSVNFTACSDDDDDIDIAQLEGTWGLVRDEGYEHYEGEKESWNDSYDPANPTEDCEKIVISKVADNTYSFASSYYYGNQWHTGDTGKFTLDGNKLIPVDGDAGEFAELVRVLSTKLRGDVSHEDILLLDQMKEISIKQDGNGDGYGYGINADDVFWVKQNIIDKKEKILVKIVRIKENNWFIMYSKLFQGNHFRDLFQRSPSPG